MTKIQEMVEYLRARMSDGPTLVNIYKIHDEAMRLYNEERAEAKKNMPQRQDSLKSQLLDVARMADKMGCYDAADVIRGKAVAK